MQNILHLCQLDIVPYIYTARSRYAKTLFEMVQFNPKFCRKPAHLMSCATLSVTVTNCEAAEPATSLQMSRVQESV